MDPLIVDDSLTVPPQELAWTAVRASGPGGQNVNKVASKVELRFDDQASGALPPAMKARLRENAAIRRDAGGCILVVSQKTRDQGRNLEDARDKLRQILEAATKIPKVRRKTKPTRASKVRRLEDKQRNASKKAGRRGKGGED